VLGWSLIFWKTNKEPTENPEPFCSQTSVHNDVSELSRAWDWKYLLSFERAILIQAISECVYDRNEFLVPPRFPVCEVEQGFSHSFPISSRPLVRTHCLRPPLSGRIVFILTWASSEQLHVSGVHDTGRIILCGGAFRIEGCSATFLASIHQVSVPPPSCNNEKCLQVLSSVWEWGTKLPLVENF
jgi:hypothetical protein